MLAAACIGVGEGGHCLNPQPDLPCNHATGDNGEGSGGTSASAGSGPIIIPAAGSGQVNVGTGGSPGDGSGGPPLEAAAGDSSAAAAGASSVDIGAGGEAGSFAGSGDAGGGSTEVVH
jgi:hypothetical protein